MYRLKRSERIRRKAPNTPTLGKRAVDKSAPLLDLCLYGRFSQPSRMCMVWRFKVAVASKTFPSGPFVALRAWRESALNYGAPRTKSRWLTATYFG